MSITYPSTPSFRAIGLKMTDPTMVYRSQNGRRVTRKVSGHLWSFTLTYPPMKRDQFGPILGALAKARGQYETFTIVPPNLASPRGTQTADTVVKTTTSAGATSVPLTGGTVGATLKAGDLIKFSNHAKVYMITDDGTFDGLGEVSVSFAPPLVTGVTATTHGAKHSSVPFTVALSNSLQEIGTDVAGFYTYELDVEEVF